MRKLFIKLFLVSALAVYAVCAMCAVTGGNNQSTRLMFDVRRFANNPIIVPDMDERMAAETERYGYANINGPSLLRVPEWVENPLGKYYLYFAHHKGEYIRLAYADDLAGPWKTYEPGALNIADSHFPTNTAKSSGIFSAAAGIWKRYPPGAAWAVTRIGIAAITAVKKRNARGYDGSKETHPHIASPDVIVDNESRTIRMYYHGMLEDRNQMSRVAVSKDGIHFEARAELLTSPYLRMFKYRDDYYGLSMPGMLCRSKNGLTDFEIRPKLAFGANMRHSALLPRGSTLYVFWSRVGDTPERILCSTIDIGPKDWKKWKASPAVEVLRPEFEWEGADLPIVPSIRGEYPDRVHELRDPFIFEEDGRTYLLYSCAGEQAIAIAELFLKSD